MGGWPVALLALGLWVGAAACGGDGATPDDDAGDTSVAADTGGDEDVPGEDTALPLDTTAADSLVADTSAADTGPATLPDGPDVARLTQLLRDLSADEMEGRLTGTPSGDRAEAYIADFLAATGAEVRRQQATFPLFEVGTPTELAVVDADGAVLDGLAYFADYREVDFSGSGVGEGALVFAGYGIVAGTHDDYAGLDVTGKVVVALTDVPPGAGLSREVEGRLDQKIHAAAERGAVALVFVPAGSDASYDRERGVETELAATDKYGALHPELLAADLPVAFVHLDAVARLVGRTPDALVADPTPFDAERRVRLELRGTTHAHATCNNVFAIFPGTDERVGSEVVVLGAHYDHLGVGADGAIFNGASDNASGAAVALETAARLAESPAFEPARTLVVALWCAEEQGLWGSLTYTYYGEPLFPLADTRLMIQLDYIGGTEGPYLSNVDANNYLARFLGDETGAATLPVVPVDWGGECASDDCAFLYVSDVPAYRFMAPGENHHRPTDVFDNLDRPMIERIADVVIRGMGDLVTSKKRITP
ncbi:MAG: M28 family peptidase [Deltaproteobacteria bacterium]|nr:MAG: M28 family peptidase [Deltaproteobacteria bacterium]